MGRGYSRDWLPSSPELNFLDFYVYRYLKLLVYTTLIENDIVNGCNAIRSIDAKRLQYKSTHFCKF